MEVDALSKRGKTVSKGKDIVRCPDLLQVWTQQLRGLLDKGNGKGKRGKVQFCKRGKVQFCTSRTQIT